MLLFRMKTNRMDRFEPAQESLKLVSLFIYWITVAFSDRTNVNKLSCLRLVISIYFG